MKLSSSVNPKFVKLKKISSKINDIAIPQETQFIGNKCFMMFFPTHKLMIQVYFLLCFQASQIDAADGPNGTNACHLTDAIH